VLRQLIALQAAGVDEVAVVLGHHAELIEPVVTAFPITVVHNPTPDAGQASSVRAGLAALSPRLDVVMVALADQPLIDGPDVVALISAFKKRPAGTQMLVPRVEQSPGNPVLFDAALRDEWLAGAADGACRRWREANPTRVAWWDTPNTRYALDIDTPEDLQRFAQRTGHTLRWPAAVSEAA
jgi:molybdenum cofactor cytidylyltransferase